MKSQQSGFTLVEIAIVLVIIGLLLGGILKGQELINSAKVKNLANDFRVIPTYIYAYQDKYRALPGDDAQVVAHNGGVLATTPSGKQGDGVIEGKWDSTTATDESVLFWNHIRKAGLMSGTDTVGAFDDADPYTPKNALGGRIGISGNGSSATPYITGMSGSYQICSKGIPGKFAKQLDIQMDDGDPSKGNMQAIKDGSASGVGVAIPAADDDATFTVCMSL
ncbi:MAG TPA: prepilin-type N-terminal cleavage/methylation domain-containing protein [Usitatibacter sp.]|nr:prepilin-type N-terminal cleavage/methylation domain-containing protein [Usitatibacter sp.]